jgi:hypothetical protein
VLRRAKAIKGSPRPGDKSWVMERLFSFQFPFVRLLVYT